MLARTILHKNSINEYGRLLALLLMHAAYETQECCIEIDAQLLADFMQAIAIEPVVSVPLSAEPEDSNDFAVVSLLAMHEYNDSVYQGLEFVRVFMRMALRGAFTQSSNVFSQRGHAPAEPMPFTPLDEVMISLRNCPHAHPALVFMCAHKLANPIFFLDYLAGNSKANKEPLHNTAFFGFLAALRPLIAGGQWQIERTDHYKQLLLTHARCQKEHADVNIMWEKFFMHAMVHNHPEQLHQTLDYLLRMPYVRFSTLNAFFPLPLTGCDGRAVLQRLVQFFIRSRTESTLGQGRNFFECLQQHHPKLAELLNLHVSICPTYEHAVISSEAMLNAFEEIHMGVPRFKIETIETIDFQIFE